MAKWQSWAQRWCAACAVLFPPEQGRCPHCLRVTVRARVTVEVAEEAERAVSVG
jgi:hypothetical protein